HPAPTPLVESISPPTSENPSTVNTSVGLTHIQEGLTFFYNGDFRRAQKSYEIAAEFFPQSAIVHERLGSIYFKLREYEKAQQSWKKANILAPSKHLEQYILNAKKTGDSQY
ncbi:MAG: tetratricopeptide repeat protein, partial [Candidatus Marinamargulisbacteria bacterium]